MTKTFIRYATKYRFSVLLNGLWLHQFGIDRHPANALIAGIYGLCMPC
jgi:hypothetical protein